MKSFALLLLAALAACRSADPAQVQHLEIVTNEVDVTCEVLAGQHGVTFSEPVPELGNARRAILPDGGHLNVRAPMAAHESEIVRPYLLVDDIEGAWRLALAAGAEPAFPPTPLGEYGTFAIYILHGVQIGICQPAD